MKYFLFCCFFSTFFLVSINSQALSNRVCTANSTLTQSRCIFNSNTLVGSSCKNYCSNSGQNSTSLYSYYCSSSSATCGLTSYCYVAPTNSTCGVPTLKNAGNSTVVVPCGYASSSITQALLNITSSSSSCGTYYINQQVVASSVGDYTAGYVQVLQNGTIVLGKQGPSVNTDQTIAFTLSSNNALGTAVYSNTVNIQFQFQTCVLQLSCPTNFSYCADPTQNTALAPPFFPAGQTPLFTCQVTNVPASTNVTWDAPGNQGATLGQLYTSLDVTGTRDFFGNPATSCVGFYTTTPPPAGTVICDYSPAVINSSKSALGAPADNAHIYISNYNLNTKVFPNAPAVPSTTGYYGLSQAIDDGILNQGGANQYLLLSATAPAPYITGTAVVQAITTCL
jgi:hypothetical protein